MPEPKTYALNEDEQRTMLLLNKQALDAKMKVYGLNMQLDQLKSQLQDALKAVEATEQQWGGALVFLSNSHGFKKVNLSPDFKTLTEAA